jgi:hypothetical protein
MSKKKKGSFGEIKDKDFHVTIFGSARVKKGDKIYRQIYSLGKMLGERGIDVVTGGGPGLMAAASNGHKEGRKNKKNNSHAIGLEIELPKEQKTNEGVDVLRRFKRFSNRLDNFMLLSDVIVVAPGGVGTLLELFYSWQLVQVNKINNIPIIILGDQYKGLVKWLSDYPMKKNYFSRKDLDLLFLAKNSEEAIRIIDRISYGHRYKISEKKKLTRYFK